jgi:S1-C subfamily serine protease
MKAGDTVSEFDGERVRSVRQFLRLVQESTPGRSLPAVLSRDGKKVTVNITPEGSSLGDEFGVRFLDAPFARPLTPPEPPEPPRAPRAPRPPTMVSPAFPFDSQVFRLTGRRLGVTIESLDSQLAEYFGVKEGVLVKSIADGSSAQKAGLKAGDVITSINGSHVYDTSDLNRALDHMDEGGEFMLEVVRDRKPQTVKGKLEARETRARTRVRTEV